MFGLFDVIKPGVTSPTDLRCLSFNFTIYSNFCLYFGKPLLVTVSIHTASNMSGKKTMVIGSDSRLGCG